MWKRVFDVFMSVIILSVAAPIIGIVAWRVSREFGSPVFFRQNRPGLHGVVFEMIKFRSMKNAVDRNGEPLPDSERLTPFGEKLRSLSLDELPGLWNVIKGDMSLVGPRPLLAEYLPRYSKEQRRRHDIRPGITGWAQVNGRNSISWEEKFKLDIWYVDHQSLWLDVRILLLTGKKVFVRDGISGDGGVTMAKFEGEKK